VKRLYIDFETFFTTDYSLSRMTTREYILDPRFEVIGASLAYDDGPVRWYDEAELRAHLAEVDWGNTQAAMHNSGFDAAILQWHYGHRAKFLFDTMGMAQALFAPTTGGAGLKKLAHLVGRGKDTGALMNMRGKRAADCDKRSEEWERYTTYANEDVETCRDLLLLMLPAFPKRELVVIDTLLRMYLDGTMLLDEELIGASLAQVRADSAQILARAGIPDKKLLRSRDKFAAMLTALGVRPPTKTSVANGEQTYAFAKNDLEFTKLLDHDNPRVVALVEAKLNASSSIAETRAVRFQALARIGGGVLNVPLRYSAARTHRFGGSDRLNLQNLGRGSPLRDSIMAPPGHKLVVVDASQIEARMLAWLAGCDELTAAFAAGRDVYCEFGAKVFHRTITKADNEERFASKTGVLGLGYGTGWRKLQWAFLTSPYYNGDAPDEFCQNIVDTYRNGYPEIPAVWRKMDSAIQQMAGGGGLTIGPLQFCNKHVLLPSGLAIQYPQLHFQDDEEWSERGYRYWDSRFKSWKKLYGASLVENVCQGLTRIIITDAMIEMRMKDPDYFCALQCHDELVYVVPDAKAQQCYDDLMVAMCRRPAWAPGLPLAAEGGIGTRYGEIK